MKELKITQTQEWIIDALLSLMKDKHYREITVSEIVSEAHIGRRTFYRYFKTKDDILLLYCHAIMQDLAHIILDKNNMTLYSVSLSYFECLNQYLDFLRLMQQSEMLYFIGDKLPEFMANVAVMTGHVMPNQIAATERRQDHYYYAFYFDIGGYWSITTLWLKKEPRETPEEMAKMIVEVIYKR
ncbi:TetR/AcrR family transcriptional regulator [Acetobacterium carbinolicum]|uniref:TetR/AcrR family transcriptional regulator n=1 Tax=Acetobacterium carbinolicum TaxID=52690 RepID=UPI0039BF3FD3